MEKLQRHVALCLITGLVTILPVGGTILLVILAERSLSPLIPDHYYFPGLGLVTIIALLYLLGLTLTTFIGKWFWQLLDGALSRFPGLGMLYRTLKQILGFESGEGALFEHVVLVPDEGTGGAEIGLVTSIETQQHPRQLVVFVPHSPNPAQGRLLRIAEDKVLKIEMSVDKALRTLFSLGKV